MVAWILIPLLSGVVAWLAVWSHERRHAAVGGRLAAAEAEVDRLKRADAARIRFFTNVAHELGTPLALILGQLDAALVETDPDARAHQLRVADRNARRIKRLADQALELTRLDAGALRPQRRDLEIVPFLEALVMSFGELAERKGTLLEFVARPRAISSPVDPDQLTTIVSNLLSNAFKFTPPGGRVGVAVETRAPGVGGGDGRLRITVADTGAGIARERQHRIFERFVRGEEDDRLHPSGAGIGLALAQELTRIHGGEITVESEPGRGARFHVELPLGHPASASADPPLLEGGERPEVTDEMLYRTTGAGKESTAGESSDRPTILVVDDNADMRDWIGARLDDVGVVRHAADGAAALDLARETLPDLVVSDARMAGVDGFEFCRRLRADERTSHIPIVMLSVLASVDRRVDGIEAGADEYLTKPIDARELHTRVVALLARRRALRERFREQVIVKPSEVSPRSVDQRFFEKLVQTIEAQIENPDFSVPELADAMGLSTSQLTRKLRALVDQSPAQLVRSLRLQRAADLIAANAATVAEIAYQVGFSDQSHFARTFKRQFGMAPSEYRRSADTAGTASA